MAANPIDLCTVDDVKGWLANQTTPPQSTPDDDEIQKIITAWSAMFIWRTGRGPMDNTEPTVSPFVEPVNYVEPYDGNDSVKLYLRNFPIQSVNSLVINNVVISPSPNYGLAGYGISGSKKYIFMRGGGGLSFTSSTFGGNYWLFFKGVQNIIIDYMAGYNGVPDDLKMACIKSSALESKRRGWIGVRSKSMAQGAGSITYNDASFEYDPDVERLIQNYSRVWLTV